MKSSERKSLLTEIVNYYCGSTYQLQIRYLVHNSKSGSWPFQENLNRVKIVPVTLPEAQSRTLILIDLKKDR